MTEKYRALSPTVCKVLNAIWQLEIKLKPQARAATRKEIAKRLGMKETYLSQILHDISKLPVSYLVTGTNSFNKQLRGRPLTTYYPNHENLTTVPETALILLELLRFPTEQMFYVDRGKFATHLKDTFGFSASFIKEKIDWAIGASYIHKRHQQSRYILALPRIDCEKEWLQMIAKRYKANKVSAKSESF